MKAVLENIGKSRRSAGPSANSVSQWLEKKMATDSQRRESGSPETKGSVLPCNWIKCTIPGSFGRNLLSHAKSSFWYDHIFEKQCTRGSETRVQIPSFKCDPEQFSQLPWGSISSSTKWRWYLPWKAVKRISHNLDKMPRGVWDTTGTLYVLLLLRLSVAYLENN